MPTWLVLVLVLFFGCAMCSGIVNGIASAGNGVGSNTATSAQTTPTIDATATQDAQNQQATVNSIPTDTPVPTDTPIPTPSSAQIEKAYKAMTTSTTVDNLDKDGNNDKGKDVSFTCKILNFVKDDSGNTAGANVEAPDSFSASIVQIAFPSGTDLSKLNQGDVLVIWGTDGGVFSGTNAFGATVQEVGVTVLYMTDQTTNYQTH